MSRKVIGFRHIQEDKTIRKVEYDKKTKKFYIKGTDIELKRNQIVRSCDVQADEFGKNAKVVKCDHCKRIVRGQSYDKWWNERNLDGSFAYNGVTDDF